MTEQTTLQQNAPASPENDTGQPSWCRRAISLVIVVCLGLQLLVFIPNIDRVIPHFPYYPFLQYGMYADAHVGVPKTTKSKMYATMADGSTADCGPKDIGLQFFVWENHYARPMRVGGPGDARAQIAADEIAERAAKAHGQEVILLHLETTTFSIIEGEIVKDIQTQTFTFEAEVSP